MSFFSQFYHSLRFEEQNPPQTFSPSILQNTDNAQFSPRAVALETINRENFLSFSHKEKHREFSRQHQNHVVAEVLKNKSESVSTLKNVVKNNKRSIILSPSDGKDGKGAKKMKNFKDTGTSSSSYPTTEKKEMFKIYQPWALQTYGEQAKTKTITVKKKARILKALQGKEQNNPDSSKFRFWVKSKGFTTKKPVGFVDDNLYRNVGSSNGDKEQKIDLYVASTTKAFGERAYRKVAVVEEFFEIIYNVHVEVGGRGNRHAGQKRTYRIITETYAFLPREAVTRFLTTCPSCKKNLRPVGSPPRRSEKPNELVLPDSGIFTGNFTSNIFNTVTKREGYHHKIPVKDESEFLNPLAAVSVSADQGLFNYYQFLKKFFENSEIIPTQNYQPNGFSPPEGFHSATNPPPNIPFQEFSKEKLFEQKTFDGQQMSVNITDTLRVARNTLYPSFHSTTIPPYANPSSKEKSLSTPKVSKSLNKVENLSCNSTTPHNKENLTVPFAGFFRDVGFKIHQETDDEKFSSSSSVSSRTMCTNCTSSCSVDDNIDDVSNEKDFFDEAINLKEIIDDPEREERIIRSSALRMMLRDVPSTSQESQSLPDFTIDLRKVKPITSTYLTLTRSMGLSDEDALRIDGLVSKDFKYTF